MLIVQLWRGENLHDLSCCVLFGVGAELCGFSVRRVGRLLVWFAREFLWGLGGHYRYFYLAGILRLLFSFRGSN